jgi:hypothetical protein
MIPDNNPLNDYIPVTRGYRHDGDWQGVDFTNLGSSWTSDPKVSRAFASHENEARGRELGGTVLHGLVHKDHALPSSHPEAIANGAAPHKIEKEVYLRPGTPVKVTKLVEYRNNKDKKGADFNDEIEGKA